ncbi:agmatinase [Microbacteriaceae bacterium SG_E_30_P1]|uniref:Agmatinase n=1 Tax=Antiquaquibacter oligotrophicus TaxID=2880260 RepID=A0ABT6KIZ7_9MICO|nr:agmatinase [Antiquaquibacter oligotrophicus]MDH6179878.1 agmatinase [Antiquaquibacter oligotrophicus]UDF14361.1 agmatinase [Antiquaquibacter oligotrophicus]
MPEPSRPVPPGLRAQLDAQSYVGPATFGMRPLLTEPAQLDEWQPDVAVVGAPWDDNTTFRPGARFGPRALRASTYDPGTYHLDLGIEIFDHLDVVDYGDAVTSHGMWELSKKAIYDRVKEVTSRGIVPFILGGDHSITWPAATAVAEQHGFGNVTMIHFDAHADTADILEGNLASHGTPMRRLIESGAIPGDKFIQVGLRGYWPGEEDQRWMRDHGLRHFMMQEFWERGVHAVLADLIAAGRERGDKVYLSIDIDVLDPAHAPATGTPEPGGFATIDLLRIVRALVLEFDVVGFDVMEVSPPYDHADLTVNAAHRLIWEAFAALAVRRRDAAS